MNERIRQGEVIDSRKTSKHLTGIVKLSALLQPGWAVDVPQKIKADLQKFVLLVGGLDRPELNDVAQRLAEA